ncbi:fatty-acid amide hydrolase 1 [Elysia marginata]|uniref:Fatty-acid amide hydrolase 1 n=1 Tax=Elysia marginata TaxID=1093978 RepID=A0AAV4JLK4_9GAST|nr:fatty-acid amide hydrolase 1 [Elysia marginata]
MVDKSELGYPAHIVIDIESLTPTTTANNNEKNGDGTDATLSGFPFSISEAFELKEKDRTLGLGQFVGAPAKSDALVFKVLKAAGGVPFIRTNVAQGLPFCDQGLIQGQSEVPACVSPMSRDVTGLVAFMRAACEPIQTEFDPSLSVRHFDEQLFTGSSPLGLRIGYYTEDQCTRTTPSVHRAINEAKKILEKNGHKVKKKKYGL